MKIPGISFAFIKLSFLFLSLFSSTAFSQLKTTQVNSAADLQQLFQSPPADSKIMMRWWWFGPFISEPEIEREMRVMKDAGIGGFELAVVYPLILDDPARGICRSRRETGKSEHFSGN